MPRPKRNYRTNTFYHLYNRGNRKHMVFFDDRDYQSFLDYLEYYSRKYYIDLFAYCLMPNHFHLTVRAIRHPEDISLLMQSSMTRFCVYINRRYELVGRTFQGTYKHRMVEDIYDLNRLMRYFLNNPVEAGMVKEGKYYKWLKVIENYKIGSYRL